MSDWDKDDDLDNDHGVVTEKRTRLKKPSMFKVLLHNDDFTTMEFVILVLKMVFLKSDQEAYKIMMSVHQAGIGIAGVYTYEVAEAKANKVIQLARDNSYPLLCTVEED
ncbi:ATP-dependent Clp protease adaptor ClpS [Candidatus Obscuribacterales bacterium]|jgi:ATP-dependent Clp protease adaptor protein ClpS|nr:ATP-dependent Clp protease adaptor ClpS [Candidatus Obscuribacterales bacterium]MBX3135788.1 ATP-dependent Clp protease adaptor ClpS [Candidatus Obscuribacterales bacterium]MBX3153154.1 ATP-dependent Clp protease adaptor ClpS [Candidatus Obscuribacterales bacterium]